LIATRRVPRRTFASTSRRRYLPNAYAKERGMRRRRRNVALKNQSCAIADRLASQFGARKTTHGRRP